MKSRLTRAIVLLVMSAFPLLSVQSAFADRDDWRRDRYRHRRYYRNWDDHYRVRVYEDRDWRPRYVYRPRRVVRTYRYYTPPARYYYYTPDYYGDRWYERETWRFDDDWVDVPIRIRGSIDIR